MAASTMTANPSSVLRALRKVNGTVWFAMACFFSGTKALSTQIPEVGGQKTTKT